MAIEVKCSTKDSNGVILGIGGTNADGTRWYLSTQDAIAGIKSGKWSFYVIIGGYRVDIIVVKTATGTEYLRTDPDKTTQNNLDYLPGCPG